MFDYESLKLIWWLIIGILLIGFAVTDGMDMGVGGLLPFVAKDDTERRVVINTIAAHWDGNQVWLITVGASFFAAWPLVYGTAFSGFYFAMMLTLFCLFLRPMGFDYRSKIDSPKWRYNWDKALFVGSIVPPLVFGIAFGNLLQGIPFSFDELMRVTNTGSFFALFNPFALLSGIVSVSMILMHGGTWLSMRTDEHVAARSAKAAQIFAAVLVVSFALAGVMIATSIDGYIIQSAIDTQGYAQPTTKIVTTATGAWLNNFNSMPILWSLPATGLVMAIIAGLLARFKPGGLAFTASALSITGVILTMGVSMFPFIMPSSSTPNHSLTLWDSVSSEGTLNLMLIVVAIFLPLILCYTIWCYSKMWRTVTRSEIEKNTHSAY